MKSLKQHISESSLYINEASKSETPKPEHLAKIKEALPELETLIQKHLSFKPKLYAEAGNKNRIQIFSKDLIKELGKSLVKTIFTRIEISFWGGTDILTDPEGNKVIWFNPKLSYEHPSRGTNGTDFIWDSLWYNFTKNKWEEGRLIIK